MKRSIATAAALVAAFATASVSTPAAASTFVFVHGAFGDAHAWDGVKRALEADGQQVVAIDLPAHGADTTPLSDVTLDRYVKATEAALARVDGKAVLVGHSLGGMVISQVAEEMPQKIQRAVFVSAFVPQDGESALGLLKQDKQSILGQYLDVAPDHATATIKPEGRVVAVCDDCPPAVKGFLAQYAAPEPMRPFADTVSLTAAHFGAVPKAYVFTSNDKALGYDIQQWMASRAGIARTATFATSHLSFVVDPKGFSQALVRLAQ